MNPLRIRLDSLEKLLTLDDFKICDLELYGIRDTCKVNWESYDRHRQWRYIRVQQALRQKIQAATGSYGDRTKGT